MNYTVYPDNQSLIPIPQIFWSDLSEKPFSKCIHCEKELIESNSDYLVEKAFKTYTKSDARSTIFEYAMCFECVEVKHKSLSVESRLKVNQYFAEHIDWERRINELGNSRDVDAWIEKCIVRNTGYSKGSEFQIYGQCVGNRMVMMEYPFMITGEVMDELVQLLSNQTLDDLNGFMDQLTSGPPELRALFETHGARVFL